MACLQRSEDHVRCESPPPTMFETGSFWRSLLCKPTVELTGSRASSNSPASALPSHQRSMGGGGNGRVTDILIYSVLCGFWRFKVRSSSLHYKCFVHGRIFPGLLLVSEEDRPPAPFQWYGTVTEQAVPHSCLCRSTCKGHASILRPPSQYSASSTRIDSSVASFAEPSMTLTSTIYFSCPCPHPAPCTDFCLSCHKFFTFILT